MWLFSLFRLDVVVDPVVGVHVSVLVDNIKFDT